MRTILIILQKEFRQIFRNKGMLPIIFIMPIVQLLILSNAADFEIRNISMYVIDNDHSQSSQKLIGKFEASEYFNVRKGEISEREALKDIDKDKADLIVIIPPHFEKDLQRYDNADIQMLVNAINGVTAGLSYNYAGSIIQDFNGEIRTKWMNMPKGTQPPNINITFSNWFNPELNYKTFMVPGILVMLVTMIGMFLSGMNIVKEKEIGTIEQLNVTPILKYQFIIGKLMPFWIIGLGELAFGLILGKLIFDIPIVGNIFVVFLFAAIYLLVVLGMGMLVSTFTDTQQQAMFISWFFMVIFILMSGLFTAIENMPEWAQVLTQFNPIAYFVKVMRMVLLKGSTLADIEEYILKMSIYAIIINGLAIWNYKKRNA